MKALVIDGPHAIAWQEVPEPPLPPGECRVVVRMAGICGTDLELSRGYLGYRGIPGHEFVGTVSEGPERLRGRRVVGEINAACGRCGFCRRGEQRHCPHRTVLGVLNRPGAFAETLHLPPECLFIVPDAVSDEEAVFVEPLAAALEIFEQVHVPPGRRVLVLGDGRLGLLIAQVFSVFGHRVTLHGRHEKKLALAKRWGVTTRLAPDRGERAARNPEAGPDGEGFPLVVEATGSGQGLQAALRHVRPRGTVVLKSTCAPAPAPDAVPAFDAAKVVVDEITLVGSRCGRFAPALRMLARGKVDVRCLIDHRVPFERAEEAFELAARRDVLKVLLLASPAVRAR